MVPAFPTAPRLFAPNIRYNEAVAASVSFFWWHPAFFEAGSWNEPDSPFPIHRDSDGTANDRQWGHYDYDGSGEELEAAVPARQYSP